jgi:hypothetical protein
MQPIDKTAPLARFCLAGVSIPDIRARISAICLAAVARMTVRINKYLKEIVEERHIAARLRK